MGRHGTVRAMVDPRSASGMKLCTDCRHCEGRCCIRNEVKAPDRVMVDVVDGSKHTFRGDKTGGLSCARERESIELRRSWKVIQPSFNVQEELVRCGPDAQFFEPKQPIPDVTINREEFMKP